jgi:hypothetical protein
MFINLVSFRGNGMLRLPLVSEGNGLLQRILCFLHSVLAKSRLFSRLRAVSVESEGRQFHDRLTLNCTQNLCRRLSVPG